MSKYKFSSFDDDKLCATRALWTKESQKGLSFPADVEQILNWVESHSHHRDGDSTAHGIFLDGEHSAAGVVEVVVTQINRNSPWVKMLRLRLQPSIEERIYNKDIAAQEEALLIFIAAIQGVTRLTNKHGAKTMKIFGRSNDQLAFLQSLATVMKNKVKSGKVEIKGRWLVVNVAGDSNE
jgi:hypothetical protein